MNKTTDFGFEQVPIDEKVKRVRSVFDSVAPKYDLMNDLMSFGIHRLWKNFTVDFCRPAADAHILDLAGGTGDIANRLAPFLNANGRITIADINEKMLSVGKERLANISHCPIEFVLADAESLPFPEQQFDLITMAFGLRNVTNKQQALNEMRRCLKPGGKAIILEFSKVNTELLSKAYDFYSFQVLPRLGKAVLDDENSYRYLAESIRKHPDQVCLKNMLDEAGFSHSGFLNLNDGIVAIHYGYVAH